MLNGVPNSPRSWPSGEAEMSPEAQRIIAEVLARQAKPKPALPEPRPKPVLIVNNDRGWGEFTVDPAYEREWHQREADRVQQRHQRRALDPFGYGHWGRFDDE
jgi:hypothetical protein